MNDRPSVSHAYRSKSAERLFLCVTAQRDPRRIGCSVVRNRRLAANYARSVAEAPARHSCSRDCAPRRCCSNRLSRLAGFRAVRSATNARARRACRARNAASVSVRWITSHWARLPPQRCAMCRTR